MKLKVWILTLFVSPAPDIIWQQMGHGMDTYYVPLILKLFFLGLATLYERLIKKNDKLSRYFIILFIILSLSFGSQFITKSADPAYLLSFLPNEGIRELTLFQVVRLTSVLILILILRIGFGFSRSYLFLQKGQPKSLSHALPNIGWKKSESWGTLGRNLAIIITVITALVLSLGSGLSDLNLEWQYLTFSIFVAVILAIANSFSEEVSYRNALLNPLVDIVGRNHAMLITSVLFGLAHYQGVPSGFLGVTLSSILGFLLAKSMLDTKGMFWAWLIHFLQDILIFTYLMLVT